jgi:hypothetical protein
LFVAFVLLCLAPVQVENVRVGGHDGQKFFNFQTYALEYAQFLEKFSLKT